MLHKHLENVKWPQFPVTWPDVTTVKLNNMVYIVRKQINPYKITWKPIQNLKCSDITYKTGTTKRKCMTTIGFF